MHATAGNGCDALAAFAIHEDALAYHQPSLNKDLFTDISALPATWERGFTPEERKRCRALLKAQPQSRAIADSFGVPAYNDYIKCALAVYESNIIEKRMRRVDEAHWRMARKRHCFVVAFVVETTRRYKQHWRRLTTL